MIVDISVVQQARNIIVTAPPGVTVDVFVPAPKVITVELFRDGKDGKNNFELWLTLPGNEGKTLEEYFEFMRAEQKTFDELRAENPEITGDIDAQGNTITHIRDAQADDDPVSFGQAKDLRDEAKEFASQQASAVTLESARSNNPQIDGNIDANGQTVENLRNAVSPQEALTKNQGDAILQASKDYTDTKTAETVRWAGFWDFSTGQYPNGIPGGIRRGDEFEASNLVPVTMPGGEEIEKGDLVRSRIATPGQSAVNWSISQGNSLQATEAHRGNMKVASPAVVGDKNTTNDTDAVTSSKLWQYFVPAFLVNAWSWTARQTFAILRLSNAGANQYLKTDANKDVISLASIPAADVATDAARSFVTTAEKGQISSNAASIATLTNIEAQDYSIMLTGDASTTTDTDVDVPGFTVLVPPGKEARILFMGGWGSSGSSTGIGFTWQVANPAGADGNVIGTWSMNVQVSGNTSLAVSHHQGGSAVSVVANTVTDYGYLVVQRPSPAIAEGGVILRNLSTNRTATVKLRFRSETLGNGVSLHTGAAIVVKIK